jgi:hypothetical protein
MRQLLLTMVAAAGLLLPPAIASGQNINMSADDEAPNDCASLNVQFDDQPAVRAEQSLTITKSKGFIKMTAARHGGIRVRGANRGDILVRVCKAVPAEGQGSGSAQLDRIVGAVTGDAVTVTGPAHDRWVAYLLVDAPEGAMLDLEATNGPLDVRDFRGRVRATTMNGPIGLANVAGEVSARAQNGPIGFEGQAGKVDLDTQNGPIQVRLGGTKWDGGGLTARAQNGPVDVAVPRGYQSGVRVASEGHSPWSCKHAACDGGQRTWDERGRQIDFGEGPRLVQITTVNGPVQINAADDSK